MTVNGSFDDGLISPWYYAGQKAWSQKTTKVLEDATVSPNPPTTGSNAGIIQTVTVDTGYDGVDKGDIIEEENGVINFIHSSTGHNLGGYGKAQILYQEIDVSGIDYLDLSAAATTKAATTKTWNLTGNATKYVASDGTNNTDIGVDISTISGTSVTYLGGGSYAYNAAFPQDYQSGFHTDYQDIINKYNISGTITGSHDVTLLSSDTNSDLFDDIPATTVRVGVCSELPVWDNNFQLSSTEYTAFNPQGQQVTHGKPVTVLASKDIFDLTDSVGNPSYKEWQGGIGDGEKELEQINVIGIDTVWIVVVSMAPFEGHAFTGELGTLTATNTVDSISVKS